MPGRGPRPKDPSRRARTNAEPMPFRIIRAEPVDQPRLPNFSLPTRRYDEKGNRIMEKFKWPTRTKQWWKMWADSPLSFEFTSTDWSELLDTALLHAQYWNGDTGLAGELRLRVAKFGATPEDRARLRITFAQADSAENKEKPAVLRGTRDRRGPLQGLPNAN